jgi:hypothetical protein
MATHYGIGFQIVGGAVGVAAAIVWFRAVLPIPPHKGGLYLGKEQGDPNTPFKNAWDRATKLNSCAALLTGTAVLIQSIGSILSAANI